MNSRQFWTYYWMTFYKPGEAFIGILQDSKSVGPAVRAALIDALLYTAVYIFLFLAVGSFLNHGLISAWIFITGIMFFSDSEVNRGALHFVPDIIFAGIPARFDGQMLIDP